MAFEMKKVLAVIPARGGSKTIPNKNLCKVGGVSLIGRAAQVINSIPWVDLAILSTDNEKMMQEGKAYGLEVPFKRPDELSSDSANSIDVWRHAWLECERIYNCRFDLSVLLEPTSPLRIPEDIERTIRVLVEGKHKAAVTVSRIPAHYTPHKTLIVKDGRVKFYLPEGSSYSLRQVIPDYYCRNGICYAITRKTLIDEKYIIGEDCAAVIIERPVANIDEPFELELAEWLFSKQDKLN